MYIFEKTFGGNIFGDLGQLPKYPQMNSPPHNVLTLQYQSFTRILYEGAYEILACVLYILMHAQVSTVVIIIITSSIFLIFKSSKYILSSKNTKRKY